MSSNGWEAWQYPIKTRTNVLSSVRNYVPYGWIASSIKDAVSDDPDYKHLVLTFDEKGIVRSWAR